MNKYYINVYVPILEEHFDLFIPAGKSVTNVTNLIIKSLTNITNGYYKSEEAKLYFKDTGKLVDLTTIVKKSGIQNGSRLILV